jgi:hypothetical protein
MPGYPHQFTFKEMGVLTFAVIEKWAVPVGSSRLRHCRPHTVKSTPRLQSDKSPMHMIDFIMELIS